MLILKYIKKDEYPAFAVNAHLKGYVLYHSHSLEGH
jgi:hypothetical protein